MVKALASSLAALAPNKRVSLPLEALKPGIHFTLAVKLLGGIFQYKAVLSTLKICYTV